MLNIKIYQLEKAPPNFSIIDYMIYLFSCLYVIYN